MPRKGRQKQWKGSQEVEADKIRADVEVQARKTENSKR